MRDQLPAAPPDPVGQPDAYREFLLEALGAQDPATVQAGTPAGLRHLVSEAGLHLRTRPAPGEWSALEAIGHIVDAEVVNSARYRFVLAHHEPPLTGYDQDLWVQGLQHNDADPSALLDLFEAMRLANVAMWRRTAQADRGRVGMHDERGPESYDLSFRLLAGHDRVHLAQAKDALRATSRS